MAKRLLGKANRLISFIDGMPLWWVGFVLLIVAFLPNVRLGEGSVFTVHDQLDESLMNYVLTARHWGEDVIPEMLGGVGASGLQPSAVLFVPLYRMLSPFLAFLCCYAAMLLCGFLGMYLAVRELTGSSILAVTAAGLFCMLPSYPVYGLSQMGIPLALYAFLCLYRGKNRVLAIALTIFFGLTSHLVYTGYAVLSFWAAAMGILFLCARISGRNAKTVGADASRANLRWSTLGFGALLATYLFTNIRLFGEILFGKGDYVSHREEMVSGAAPFLESARSVFLESLHHAPTYHRGMILPLFALLAVAGIFYRRLSREATRRFWLALCGMLLLIGIALFYAFCKWEPVVQWKNARTGFLRYFQADRFYWLYPAGWYLELAIVFSIWWEECRVRLQENGKSACLLLLCVTMAAVVYPTADTVLKKSYFYRNVNQYNNGSGITGEISWESWYAEDLMREIDAAIGREKDTYRIAHLGISPAPALMHGFYTVDGYSNNYPLAYKHAFRRVIAAELDKSPETAVYFDKWGNRCYLFNSISGTYWMAAKGSDYQYAGLEFDMDALAGLGCEYLFSGAEIADAEEMGLKSMGYFETETSYWGIWLYQLSRPGYGQS